jgi:2-polyprenyl-3-methyl-5-hydroxy-6-metoxy-1,4-benzoquinol methylase
MQPLSSDLDHLKWLEAAEVQSLAGKNILDLGCGSGYICHKAMNDGANSAIGIDLVKPAAEANKWRFLQLNLDEKNWDRSLERDTFNLILAFDILEHLESPYQFLKSCRNLMAPDARLVLTTPNLMSWERFFKPENWSGVQDPQHKVLFTKYSLRFLLRKVGLSVFLVKAPMRSLTFLNGLQPQIGGQLLCVATPT